MARYNSIFAGPFTEARPQVHEALASVAILPGLAIVLDADGEFALAGPATSGRIFIAQDNYLTLSGVDVAWGVGETTIGLISLDEQLFNVRVADGFEVIKGEPVALAANGYFAPAATGDYVVGFAEESFTNASGADDLVRIRAANGFVLANSGS